jgi:hypothetical protein
MISEKSHSLSKHIDQPIADAAVLYLLDREDRIGLVPLQVFRKAQDPAR